MPTQRTLDDSFHLNRGKCSVYFEWIKQQWSLPEFPAMQSHPDPKSSRPVVELLEERSLLSGFKPLAAASLSPAMIGQVHPTIATDPAGIAAVISALEGGMGSEWVSLIRAGVKNPLAVIAGFESGKYTSYSIPGLTAQAPSVQPGFVGTAYDQQVANLAGAAVFKGNVLELGAIMRGPFHDPATSYYVFAFNRGAGASEGPTFASRPGITPDAIVTLAVGPYGQSATGTITDLTTHSTQAIPSSSIEIRGPVVRVFLKTSQLPSKGWPLAKYRFAFWTQSQPGNNISTVVILPRRRR
jgi:hypothetical protein